MTSSPSPAATSRCKLSAAARDAMERSAEVVRRLADSPEPAYGVSTGFGSLANVRIPAERREELQRALIRSTLPASGRPWSARWCGR